MWSTQELQKEDITTHWSSRKTTGTNSMINQLFFSMKIKLAGRPLVVKSVTIQWEIQAQAQMHTFFFMRKQKTAMIFNLNSSSQQWMRSWLNRSFFKTKISNIRCNCISLLFLLASTIYLKNAWIKTSRLIYKNSLTYTQRS